MRIIGHRGTPAAARCPENTLAAVQAALDAGVHGVEVDVRATRDDVLVLSHDRDLGRVLGGQAGAGPVVADTSWSALSSLPLPHGTTVARLIDVLDLVGEHGAHVVTEVKVDPGPHRLRTARLLAQLLTARRRTRPGVDRVTTTSFDLPSSEVLVGRGAGGSGVILEPHVRPIPSALRARAYGLTQLHLSVEHVIAEPAIVGRVHALGLGVGAGIVDDAEGARWLAGLGVDLLCTDAPWQLTDHLVGRSREKSRLVRL